MLKRLITPSLFSAILVIFSGCAGSPAWHSIKMTETSNQAKKNNEKMMGLNVGQSKDDVVAIMGGASKREVYHLANSRNIEFLFYRTAGWSAVDAGDKDHHFTPFAFEDDRLIGWGRNYYDNVVRSSVELTVNEKQ